MVQLIKIFSIINHPFFRFHLFYEYKSNELKSKNFIVS